MSDSVQLYELLQKVRQGVAGPEDYRELRRLLDADTDGSVVKAVHAFHSADYGGADQVYDQGYWQVVLDQILAVDKLRPAAADELQATTRSSEETGLAHRLTWRRFAVAAAVIGLLGSGAWWLIHNREQLQAPAVVTTQPHDVSAPAVSRATLTLSNGQKIALDSAANGAIADQGGASVVKDAGGRLTYQVPVSPTRNVLLYNTLSNPRGSRVITLTLADGTRVWLNAESSIRYPAIFTGNDRAVEMTGEAYFEVAKDAAKPFRVTVAGETVNVLGTSFNVNAYADGSVLRTTLADGAISVTASGTDKRLEAGQQAVYDPSHQRLSIDAHADLDRVLAWKNGLFGFAHTDLKALMQELGRWYNVDVHYEGAIPEEHFSGRLERSLTLDQVLHILTNHKIHYSIEPNRTLIIRP